MLEDCLRHLNMIVSDGGISESPVLVPEGRVMPVRTVDTAGSSEDHHINRDLVIELGLHPHGNSVSPEAGFSHRIRTAPPRNASPIAGLAIFTDSGT